MLVLLMIYLQKYSFQVNEKTNAKIPNMITKNEAKIMVKYVSYDYKFKFNNWICKLNQKWNNDIFQDYFKNYRTNKKDYSCNPGTGDYENSKHLKGYAEDSVNERDEIIYDMDIASTNKRTTMSRNVSADLYKMDCYGLQTVLFVMILLFIITIIYFHYAKYKC